MKVKVTNTKQIIALAELRESMVKAYFDHYYKQMGEENKKVVQEMTDSYAGLLAEHFIAEHDTFFAEERKREKINYKIRSLGADKKHSGYRFWEALGKAMKNHAAALEADAEEQDL